ncbi:MAG: flagellar hook capping FlgD N-terminal domain-containing protein [Bacillota bacterium]|nr:flagellar hook capping FlgD N-terminal domain-containing protein [Bacillota bacterium]
MIYATSVSGAGTQTTPSASTPAKAQEILGKDDFLLLLVTQLQHQNPLEPMEDREFIAQMAQFSSLEQLQNLTKAVEGLTRLQTDAVLMAQATGFLGRTVTVYDPRTDTEVKGTVTSVKVFDGVPRLVIGGEMYDVANVLEVA